MKTEIFKPEVLELIQDIPFLDPEDISQAVIYALSTRPHVQVKTEKQKQNNAQTNTHI